MPYTYPGDYAAERRLPTFHKDADPNSQCGGRIADGRELFNTDYWCVYCGAKINRKGQK